MINLPIYQVDAFTQQLFKGNPAAVVPLQHWLDDHVLQNIALENNLAETAFFVPEGNGFHLRWFTPAREVNLCGHATLATSHVISKHLGYDGEELVFQSKSGELRVRIEADRYVLNFPANPPKETEIDEQVVVRVTQLTGQPPLATAAANKELVVLCNEEAVKSFSGLFDDFESVQEGVILTAKSDRPDIDFVSRYFGGASLGIPEDPVTGAAHCVAAPYWAEKLGKTELQAEQVSARGGRMECRVLGDRVELVSQAVTYLTGEICVPQVQDQGGN